MSLIALASLSVGLHLGSQHFPEQDYHNQRNVGVYALADNGVVGGFYKNSHDRTTVYAGKVWKVGPFDAGVVGATGYDRKCNSRGECHGFSKYPVTPLVAITYAPPPFHGVRPRVWVAPGLGKASTVLHFSLEWTQ